ncbi:hypothetical protein, conserved [Eimeria tenella]|uniref:EF-hand domain-containing protein n=1 Tax=Eimeria tenella TaxID=5802 RepID=U6KUZ8_EIMTE|nr:hypothetical protein, conserved [Eimeria tenella]CDJ40189.1 hypothetical protein, conserved [Eimeria tenella]|eukprot:XP_013230942.1 hypothetical protein, conserved [Eimeria tenella]
MPRKDCEPQDQQHSAALRQALWSARSYAVSDAAASVAAVEDESKYSFRPRISAESQVLAAAAAAAAAAARPAAEAAAVGNCNSVHLRLYYQGLESRRKKQQQKILLLRQQQQQRSRCSAVTASSSSSSSSSASCGLLISQQLYEDALTRRRKQQQQLLVLQREQQHLSSSSKLTAASLRVFKQRLSKELKQAYASLQQQASGASGLPAPLLPDCLQLLGIFQHQHEQQQQLLQRTNPVVRARKQLTFQEATKKELRLADRLCSLLDPEGSGKIQRERLFQFLAGLLSDCSRSSSGSSSSTSCSGHCGSSKEPARDSSGISNKCSCSQLAAATKRLENIGIREGEAEVSSVRAAHAATQLQQETLAVYAELRRLSRDFLPLLLNRQRSCFFRNKSLRQAPAQEAQPKVRCSSAAVTERLLERGRQRQARRELLQQQRQQGQQQRCLRSPRSYTPTGNSVGGPWGPPTAAQKQPKRTKGGVSRHVQLFELAQYQQQQQEQQKQLRQQQQQQDDLKECTFRPDLGLSHKAPRGLGPGPPPPVGFGAAIERLRRGAADRERLFRFYQNRQALSPRPTHSHDSKQTPLAEALKLNSPTLPLSSCTSNELLFPLSYSMSLVSKPNQNTSPSHLAQDFMSSRVL